MFLSQKQQWLDGYSIFSLGGSRMNLADLSYYGLHCEMVFAYPD
jgi:hypothetical protein